MYDEKVKMIHFKFLNKQIKNKIKITWKKYRGKVWSKRKEIGVWIWSWRPFDIICQWKKFFDTVKAVGARHVLDQRVVPGLIQAAVL